MRGAYGDEELVEFAFESEADSDLTPADLLMLARACWQFNTRMGLTGEIRLQGERFIQTIEGPCAVVQPLAARILADPRHGLIRIDAFGRVAAKRFSTWRVSGFASPADAACPLRAANLRSVPREAGFGLVVSSL